MSKMSELATTLDDLTRVVKAVITCGEDVLRAVAHVREFFSGNDNAVPKLQEPVKAAEPVAETPAPKAYKKSGPSLRICPRTASATRPKPWSGSTATAGA